MNDTLKPKVLVVVGPTASGKTALAITLAKTFNGEVISADSRQVYRGLDIGTDKVPKENMDGIPHHLIDVCDVTDVYTAADFKRDAAAAITDITSRGKLPIVAGGTGFYIQALIDNLQLPEVPPNEMLRKELEKLSSEELFKRLREKDTERAETIDPHNRRRLVRALEIAEALGSVPSTTTDSPYDALFIGIDTETETLREKIRVRLHEWFEKGLIDETRKLIETGISDERISEIGFDYSYVARYIRGELSRESVLESMEKELFGYVKRQKTWFKRDKRIKWFKKAEQKEIEEHITHFLEKD